MGRHSPAFLTVSLLVVLLSLASLPSAARSPREQGAWRQEGPPTITKRPWTEDCNYFGSRLDIGDGSATGSQSWKDCSVNQGVGRCSGTYTGSVTWTRPPSVLEPGDKLSLTGTAKTSARNSCGYRNIGSGITLRINNSTFLDVIERLGSSLTGEFTVPRGTPGAKLIIEAVFQAAGLHGTTVYTYVYDSTPAPVSPPGSKSPHEAGPPPTGGESPDDLLSPSGGPTSKVPNCVWTTFTYERRSFATQPGQVLPLRTPFAPGRYYIHVGPAGPDGLTLPPPRVHTFGPKTLVGGHKYVAIPRDEGQALWWRADDDPRLTGYPTPPKIESRLYSRNEASLDTWYGICLTPAGGGGAGSEATHEPGKMVFSNFNDGAVEGWPVNPTVFTLDRPTYISVIRTYHWNDKKGAPPGQVRLRHESGRVYGPWQAIGVIGALGVSNAFWVVSPNVTLPAGSYEIHDSDLSTWSHNSASGGRGFSQVEGRVGAAP